MLVSVLGLIGDSATQPLLDNLGKVAPGPAQDIVTSAIKDLQSGRGSAGLLFVIGARRGAVVGIGLRRGPSCARRTRSTTSRRGGPMWKTLPVRVGLTLVLLVLVAISAIAVVLTGGLARQVGDLVGLGSTALTVWDIAKWPVLLLVVSFMFALLYWAAPNVRAARLPLDQPGRHAGRGRLGDRLGGVRLLRGQLRLVQQDLRGARRRDRLPVWLWISNIAVLLGAEFNAELERGRAIEAGHPPDREPFVEPRDTSKMESRQA